MAVGETIGLISAFGGGNGGGGSSGGGVLVVHIDEEYTALDKTWQEIHDAYAQGILCVALYANDEEASQGIILDVYAEGPPDAKVYIVSRLINTGTPSVELWNASSADGYPAYQSN